MESGAFALQPGAGRLRIRLEQLRHQGMEIGPMIQVDEVGDFVRSADGRGRRF